MNNNRKGCTYNEFLAYNPKEYDGKGGAIVYTRWIEKMESVQDMSGCEENQKVKVGHAAYTDRFYELARLVPHLVTPESKRIQWAMKNAGTLIDKAIRNRSIKKNPKKKGNGREPNRDTNARDENKMTRTGNGFAITINLDKGNHPNQVVANDEGQGCGNNGKQECGRAFMMEVYEARQDPNILTDTFTLKDYYATTLFNSGMDWLSNHKAEIVCHDKANEQKREEIVVVRDFPELFLDDLSGLPLIREIKFRIELIPGVILFTKSPYRLASSKIEGLSGQLKELQDKTREEHEAHLRLVLELLKELKLYASNANVVADALSRKEIMKPKRIRSMNMTLHSNIKDRILTAQEEASDEPAEMQRGMDEPMEHRSDGALYYLD
nr:hypothetical protein [Tanacetum cinerariifolium]